MIIIYCFITYLCRASEFRRFSDKSDVYSFGVFLLELVSGQEAKELLSSDVNQNLVEWVSFHLLVQWMFKCSTHVTFS